MRVSTKQITQTVAPVVEPVTLTEMKLFLREDYSDNDTLITAQITAARQWVEKEIQQSLVQRTYRADLWAFDYTFYMPVPPLASVSSIKYYNTDSPQVLTTLDSTVYRTDTGYGIVYLNSGSSWEAVSTRHDAVQITFVAGYAPDTSSPVDHAANVPEGIKAAIKLQVGDMFSNRETSTPLKITMLPTVDRLLAVYREY